MAERTPVVRKYRDALEAVISTTMEFMAGPARAPSPLRLRLLPTLRLPTLPCPFAARITKATPDAISAKQPNVHARLHLLAAEPVLFAGNLVATAAA
jgi:hypothetical protein